MENTIIIVIENNKKVIDLSIECLNNNINSKLIFCGDNTKDMINYCNIENLKTFIIATLDTEVKNKHDYVDIDKILSSIIFCREILNKIYSESEIKPHIIFCASKIKMHRIIKISGFLLDKYPYKNFKYVNERMTNHDNEIEGILINRFYFKYNIK